MSMSEPDTARNKEVVRRWYAAVENHDLDALEQLYDEAYTTGPYLGFDGEWTELDLAGEMDARARFVEAFPDISYELHEMVAEADWVALRKTFTGTHEGELHGLPATGRTVEVGGHATFRFEDGLIVEINGTNNILRALVQLGFLELPLVD